MFYQPPSFRVLGIDPGNNMGITVGEVNAKRGSLEVIDVLSLVLDKAISINDVNRKMSVAKDELVEDYLCQVIGELLEYYDVDAVVYESAYNAVSVNAYKSLLFYGRLITQISTDFDYDILIESKTPSTIKKLVGVKGTSGDKTLMTEAVRNNSSIILPEHISIDELTDHAIDSIAIAYSVVRDLMASLKPRRLKGYLK